MILFLPRHQTASGASVLTGRERPGSPAGPCLQPSDQWKQTRPEPLHLCPTSLETPRTGDRNVLQEKDFQKLLRTGWGVPQTSFAEADPHLSLVARANSGCACPIWNLA